ncbi:hypothetical protein P43SY_001027 [Pythium insidiosum]|uniref:TKL protein kinase n=1 Tax=Pythium insidiosum TaxID=114742 RepID=A0AAD5LSA4_PYTIN|nr:hypothetical protein P43SY_001027 [Pythium insidiosum]
MASSVPVSDSFQFDGTTSDLAQQFYRRHRAGYKADKLEVTPTAAITSRVEALDLTFDELPGLLQRALIWDSGFVFTLKNDLMAVKTLDGRSMDQIAVSLASYLEVGCKTQECDTPNQRAKWYKNGQCNGAQMISAALCAMDMLPHDEEAQMSMWSTGGEPTSVPDMIAYHHHWTDSQTRVIYAMHVIHTRSKALSPKYGECSPGSSETTGIGSLVIPCAPTKALNGTTAARFQAPKPGKIVSAWLNEYKAGRSVPATTAPASTASPNKGSNTDTTKTDSKPSSNHTTLLVIVSIIGVAILLVLLIVIFLDTHEMPYSHVVGADGKVNEVKVIQEVSIGRVQVSFSRSADAEMVALARSCMSMVPSERPSAAEVLSQVHRVWRRLQSAE